MYVSHTHFKITNPIGWFLFQFHAVRSGNQAGRSKGNVKWTAWAATIRNVCTVSVWESEAHMRAFMTSGAHLVAMKLSRYMGHGYTVGWEIEDLDALPDLQTLRVDGERRLREKLRAQSLEHWLPA
ncbi:hypothetical protein HZ996_02585 [Cryomorphaceae bacterium]|nr:hypothetical protein HZ996_02585 [Cryomorphaceae bacterium]